MPKRQADTLIPPAFAGTGPLQAKRPCVKIARQRAVPLRFYRFQSL
jgi:hypothetical protein